MRREQGRISLQTLRPLRRRALKILAADGGPGMKKWYYPVASRATVGASTIETISYTR
jgi:hypothetical protein